MPTLRERAGLSIAELAAKLVERFSLDGKDTERTAGYLDRLERGALDPTRVSRRLTDALGGILGVGERDVRRRRRPTAAACARPPAAGRERCSAPPRRRRPT